MTTSESVGQPAQNQSISLHQLAQELSAAGVVAPLGMHDGRVYTYTAEGQPADFASTDQATVDQAIANHVAMRDKTDAEYAAEFQALGGSATGAPRKQEIRDIMMGLLPRETVPMEA